MAKYFKRGGREWEDDLARDGVGKRQPLSGAGWAAKNDLKDKKLLIEAKHTQAAKTYSLHKDDLRKLRLNASRIGRVGVMFLDFSGDEYVIMRRSDWEQYIILDTSPEQIIDGNNAAEVSGNGADKDAEGA